MIEYATVARSKPIITSNRKKSIKKLRKRSTRKRNLKPKQQQANLSKAIKSLFNTAKAKKIVKKYQRAFSKKLQYKKKLNRFYYGAKNGVKNRIEKDLKKLRLQIDENFSQLPKELRQAGKQEKQAAITAVITASQQFRQETKQILAQIRRQIKRNRKKINQNWRFFQKQWQLSRRQQATKIKTITIRAKKGTIFSQQLTIVVWLKRLDRSYNKQWQKRVRLLARYRKFCLARARKVKFPRVKIPKLRLKIPQIRIPQVTIIRQIQLPKLPSRLPTCPKLPFRNPFQSLYTTIRRLLTTVRRPFTTTTNFCRRHPRQAILSASVTIIITSGSIFIYHWVFKDLPSPYDLQKKHQSVTTRILDRNGKLLFRIYEDENRTLIPLSAVSQDMIDATLAIEDKSFYKHWGFDVEGIMRALVANLQGKPVQGGSTLTQQLVKNRLLSPERIIQRKVREIVLAVLVEGVYSKDEILEMYFNQVAYGGSTYGVEEAAWRYFNKSAKNLTLAESSLLAGLPAAPSVYTPFGSNPELVDSRQAEVLRRMVEDSYLTQEEADTAKAQELQFRQDVIDIRAPHFVMYVKRLLADQYGYDVLYTGGLEVRTTLDLDLQDEVQQVVTDEVNALARLRVNNGASLVTNPQTGEILAMVGSKDYFDFENDGQVNVTIRPRQPGSSIKPLTYALVFERGKTPSSMIDDTPVTYSIAGSPPYSPKNYDGKYHGRVSMREALASSYNIPAVKNLAEISVSSMLDKAQDIGISTWQDRKRFGLSLTLGGGEILMTEMAELYGTFVNLGQTVPLNPVLEIKNSQGQILYRNNCAADADTCQGTKNFEPLVSYQITDILSDNRARTPAFGPQSVLHIPGQQVAVKTGTTNNLRDNWTIGYTTDRLVAVWVGNNDNTSMSYVASGITGASPIWNDVMRLLLDENDPHQFATPDNLVKIKICAQTGTLPCRGCPTVREELFLKGTEPQTACNPAQFRPRPTLAPSRDYHDPGRDQIHQGIQIDLQ